MVVIQKFEDQQHLNMEGVLGRLTLPQINFEVKTELFEGCKEGGKAFILSDFDQGNDRETPQK